MAFLRVELYCPGAKSRYHFMMHRRAPNSNLAKRAIANTMHLRSPSAERELCPPWVKIDRGEKPIVLIRAHLGQGNEQVLSARASHFGGTEQLFDILLGLFHATKLSNLESMVCSGLHMGGRAGL
eukprot:11200414-Lingulodinium_polyedra.AAC.1